MASEKPTILIQLDTDAHASVFDAVVAVDSGVHHLLQYGGVSPENVRGLVHGAMFTRGLTDLNRTAIFVGGSHVAAAEAVFQAVRDAFFDPFRVSVMMDANGCNTTAAAAVRAVETTLPQGSVEGVRAVVLGGTGPVGQRVARLLSRSGAIVGLASRQKDRAGDAASAIQAITNNSVTPITSIEEFPDPRVVVAAGAAGVTLLHASVWRSLPTLEVLVDLNAVPPVGIEEVSSNARNQPVGHLRVWGALGTGGIKMKIHKESLKRLFSANNLVMNAEELLNLARELPSA